MTVVVVLGRRLNDDGSMHNDLIKRCDKALQYIKENNSEKFILSGGAPNKKAGRAEAVAMKEYFIEKGAPLQKIIVEDKSKTTYQNAKFCSPILKELKAEKVIICTSQKHLARRYLNPLRLFRKRVKFAKVEPIS